MSKAASTIGIELRFWPNDRVSDWERTFAALWSWDPDLRPQVFHVASGEGRSIDNDRPWDEASLAELVRLCTGRGELSWFLGNDSGHYLQCSGREGRISIAIQIPAPKTAVADHYLDLIARMPESNRPELGLLFNFGDVEAAFDQEGLRRLRYVPPILHLGPRAVEKLGGHEKLRQAPCTVRDAPGGGLLFVVRANPSARPTKTDKARTREVSEFLGIGEEEPLVLAPFE